MRRLGRKLLNIALKMILVAIPAIVSSYLTYRVVSAGDAAERREFSKTIHKLSKLLDNHSLVLAEMQGEVSVLRQLASVRVGMGMSPFPPEICEAPTPADWQDLLPSPEPDAPSSKDKILKMRDKASKLK